MKKFEQLIILVSILFSTFLFAQSTDQLFQQALLKENGEGDLKAAVTLYEQIVFDETVGRELRAKAQLHIGMCWEKMGKQEATAAYQKVLDLFPEQEVASTARVAIHRLNKDQTQQSSGLSYQKLASMPFAGHQGGYISPSGRYIAYGAIEGGVAIYDIITNDFNFNPTQYSGYPNNGIWAADESAIAFAVDEKGIFIMKLPNGIPEQVSFGSWDFPIKFGDDNLLYYFTGSDSISKLVAYDLITKKLKTLTIFQEKDKIESGNKALSPNNHYLAYISSRDGQSNLWIRDLQNDIDRKITSEKTSSGGLAWSFDGNFLAFGAWRDDQYNIKVLSMSDHNMPIGNAVQVVNSPAGQYLYTFSWTRKNELCYGQKTGFEQLFISDSDSKIQMPLTTMQSDQQDPAWSPDGKHICFVSDILGRGKDVLWLVSSKGGRVEQLTFTEDGSTIHVQPAWSADGKEIIYIRRKGWTNQTLWKSNVENGKSSQLSTFTGRFVKPCYSPDNRSIYFGCMLSSWDKSLGSVTEDAPIDRLGLFELYLKNNSVKMLSDPSSKVDYEPFSWTPDGSKLVGRKSPSAALNDSLSSLWIYEQGKGIEDLVVVKNKYILITGISPDSRSVRYSTWNAQEGFNQFIVPIDGGSSTPDNSIGKDLWIRKWSPDNVKFIFTKDNKLTEFWLVRNIESVFANK